MRHARPERAIEQHVERDGVVRRGEHVVVACSGGPDSVALAGVLHALSKPLDLTLTLAHVNHGVRAGALQDECIVLRLAATFGSPVKTVLLRNVQPDEAALREARYLALAEVARAVGASSVATAHHAEDQSETVLLALFRGGGPDGLTGMEPRRRLDEGIDVIRPLLRIESEDLRAYCHAYALPYAIDPTNADATLRRNAVRQALAALRPLFPGLDAAVARAAHLVSDETRGTQRATLRRAVRDALRDDPGVRDVNFIHVEEAVRALEAGSSGRFFMKKGVTLSIDRGTLSINKDDT
jgi:tRNA(Ile)-lysidine synthase